MDPESILNFNVGVLGHVDSGKTSLVKALSTTASTACFDKNPQSKERGITLDLGFSSFIVEIPDHVKEGGAESHLQVTLVDCPGHASLIRTIIGGSQIIDLMMLVVDVTKGIQTQTAECLIIGEILCDKMIVVLNKIDMVPESNRRSVIDKMSKRLNKTLESTRFKQTVVVPVSACVSANAESPETIGIDLLIDTIKEKCYRPVRDVVGPSLFSVDHCFSIRGQGTVMTGTMLRGTVRINDEVEISDLKVTKKVKSMQMFKKPVQTAKHGDRVGVCVTQFDSKLLERGYVSAPGSLLQVYAAVTKLNRIPYYKQNISSKQKYHITVGHDTIMATLQLFTTLDDSSADTDKGSGEGSDQLNIEESYLFLSELSPDENSRCVYCLLEFEKPITCTRDAIFIGSRLEMDVNTTSCRIAFHGKLTNVYTNPQYHQTELPKLKICKLKQRAGQVERAVDDYTLIGRNLFKKETNIEKFVGLKVSLSTGEKGVIEGSFGQSGKFKIRLSDGLKDSTKPLISSETKKKGKTKPETSNAGNEPVEIILEFKRYIYDPKKLMSQ